MPKSEKEEKHDDDEKTPAGVLVEVAPVSRCSSFLDSDAKTGQVEGALLELKDLRGQLHQAADYCEDAFMKAEKKKIILDSTKKYICDSIVSVIDHLGTVSSKLEHQVCNTIEITQTEQKIDFLKHRLMTCRQFAMTIELSALRYNEIFSRNDPHCVLQGERLVKCNYKSREEKEDLKTIKDSKQGDQLGLSGRFRLATNLFSRHDQSILPSSPSAKINSSKDAHIFQRENKTVHRRNNFWSLGRKNKEKFKIISSRVS